MNDFEDEILNALPHIEARSGYHDQLMSQVVMPTAQIVPIGQRMFASFAVAASLAAGVVLGSLDALDTTAVMSTLGFGSTEDTILAAVFDTDPYSATFENL